MPVVNFHLVEGLSTPAQDAQLLTLATQLYCAVLQAPVERVRAFITLHAPSRFAVAGVLVADGAPHAPVFDFIVLEGRPLAERQRLMVGFTDLLVDILGVRREWVRGNCRRVTPEDWCIGGQPASVLRADEVRARAEQAQRLADPG
jgi:phenylpyruvate tautomerase PptA (4-oxalocrotonate tautomerase family)